MEILRTGWINRLSKLWPGLPVIGLIIALRLLGLLQPLEWKTLDVALRKRPAEPTDTRITIINITEEDIQTALRYPIADADLAALLAQIQTYNPRVIGLDIFRDMAVGEGHNRLVEIFQTSDNIVGINRISEPTVPAPAALPPDQVGFADALLDSDGFLRRSFLGTADAQGDYQFSFTIRMAQHYLADEGLILENGLRNPATMRFGKAEIPRFQQHTGGYVWADYGGNQTLINFRAGFTPFSKVTYQALMAGQVDPELLADRIVLIGYSAASAKDVVNVAALAGVNPGLVPGVDVQAHAISQIVSAALDGRVFLQALPVLPEYFLIIISGLLGAALACGTFRLSFHLLTVVGLSGGLVLLFWGGILVSWWLPIVPVLGTFLLNAVMLYPMYQVQSQLKTQIEQRQQLIDWTFNTIHSGPLQTLAGMLREWPEESQTPNFEKNKLQQLDRELRKVHDAMEQEMLLSEDKLVLNQQVISLHRPLQELLYETYQNTTQKYQAFFQDLLHITDFKEMDDSRLTPMQKRELSRFLEEMLINVSKYATGATRLVISCLPEDQDNVIRVIDNGKAEADLGPQHQGFGTQQTRKLAKNLGGTFSRSRLESKGMQCELRWPIRKRGWWKE
jgi:CHASE2 domain-containing sensor protein/two-component sensor histidine kinase